MILGIALIIFWLAIILINFLVVYFWFKKDGLSVKKILNIIVVPDVLILPVCLFLNWILIRVFFTSVGQNIIRCLLLILLVVSEFFWYRVKLEKKNNLKDFLNLSGLIIVSNSLIVLLFFVLINL